MPTNACVCMCVRMCVCVCVCGVQVYGPRGPGGVMMKTCSQQDAGVTVCTDECGGYFDASGSIDEFTYRYYIMGTYHEARDANDCKTPLQNLPGAEYFPFTVNDGW